MGSDRRPGRHARSKLEGWTWPRGALTLVAVLANLAFLGILAFVILGASPHTAALRPGTVARCLGQPPGIIPLLDNPEVRFQRPWVLRIDDGSEGRVLLCEYAPSGDDQPPQVVRVWEVDS